jgi:lia operon protein LiaG
MRKCLGIILILCSIAVFFVILKDNFIETWFSNEPKQTETAAMNRVQTINIESSSAKVKIIPEDRNDVTAVLHKSGNTPADLVVEREGNSVKVAIERRWFDWFSFNKKMTLTVYMPMDYNNDMSFDLSSGNLEFDGSSMKVNELEVDMSSGNVDL